MRGHIVFLIFRFLSTQRILCQDPCTTNNAIIINDPTRSVNYKYTGSQSESCDRTLTENWYRIINDVNIPTQCPAVLSCGSTAPIWINGTLPTLPGQEVVLPACQRGFILCCDFSWNIRVRNCGTFNLFRLIPTRTCPGRYCVENMPALCPPGTGSESGFEPCLPINITFSVTPYVYPTIPTLNPFSPYNQLAFECQVKSMPSSYHNYLFDVQWKIGSIIVNKTELSYSILKSNGTLHRIDWDPQKTHQLGFKVSCAIRARAFKGAPPTEYIRTIEFFAGVTVERTDIVVQSGKTAVIRVKSTVPVACMKFGNITQCTVVVELFSYKSQFVNTQPHCDESLTKEPQYSSCALEFDGQKWNEFQNFLVSALADQSSRPSYNALVKLRAISARDTLWGNYAFPDIRVTVVSQLRPIRHCSSYTDPHIRTVDGNHFVSTATGEFVLYRIKGKPVQIHTIQNRFGYNCAVAVRAASDIFIVYGCFFNIWIVRRLNCEAKTQHLQVFERLHGRNFEVFLPTGTRVVISIRNSWVNVHVYTSQSDWNQTEGLCGTYNGVYNDDFTDRNGHIVSTSNHIKSWVVNQKESLFIARIRNEILRQEYLYCSCDNKADSFLRMNVTPHANCSWEESLPLCPPLNWGTKECLIKGKRNAEDDLEIDVPVDMVEFEESKLNESWKNGWNESTARQTCENALKSLPVYDQCSSLNAVDIETTVKSCITDIKITGQTTFLNDVKEQIKAECVSELRYNASLWTNKTSTGDSFVDSVFENVCPSDCSFAGTCVKGLCVCNASRTGEDCSVDLLLAPTLFKATEQSLCDLSKRPCISISVFGEGFYPSAKITCNIQEALFLGSNITGIGKEIKVFGDLESFSEVTCPIEKPRRKKRSTDLIPTPDALLISVSMDGAKFSSEIPIVMYNSHCHECNVTDGNILCHNKTDICVVSGGCYPSSDTVCRDAVETTTKDVTTKETFKTTVAAETTLTKTTKSSTPSEASSALTTNHSPTDTSNTPISTTNIFSQSTPEPTRQTSPTTSKTTKSTSPTTSETAKPMSPTISTQPFKTTTRPILTTYESTESGLEVGTLGIVIGLPVVVIVIFVTVFAIALKIHLRRSVRKNVTKRRDKDMQWQHFK